MCKPNHHVQRRALLFNARTFRRSGGELRANGGGTGWFHLTGSGFDGGGCGQLFCSFRGRVCYVVDPVFLWARAEMAGDLLACSSPDDNGNSTPWHKSRTESGAPHSHGPYLGDHGGELTRLPFDDRLILPPLVDHHANRHVSGQRCGYAVLHHWEKKAEPFNRAGAYVWHVGCGAPAAPAVSAAHRNVRPQVVLPPRASPPFLVPQ